MKFSILFRRIRKGLVVFIPLALLAGYSVHKATGYVFGITGASTIGCSSGGGCHGSQSSTTVVKIYTAAPQIVAGQTYVFSLSVANPSELGAGCDISVDKGGKLALNGSNSGLQSSSGELTHYPGARTFTGGSAVWTFQYTAPKTVGVAHIYAAGNAVNLDGRADAGDHWNTTVYPVTVVSAGVESSDKVESSISISPNPSRGRITISTPALSGPAAIEVSDAAGRTVFSETVMMGTETPLDLSHLQNGSYFLQVRPREGQSFTRSIVIEK